MDNTQIQNALARLFDEEGHRIVFWNDPEMEFVITVPLLDLPEGVQVLRLDQMGAFEAKIRIERDDPEGYISCIPPPKSPNTRPTGCLTFGFTAVVFGPIGPPLSLINWGWPISISGST